jgi:SSS family transporter
MSEICIIVTIVVYLAAMLLVGFAYSKTNNDSTDFYLGGRKMGPLVTAMSAEASDMSSWLLMGMPGLAYLTGIASPGWTAIGLALGTWLNWLIVARRLRRYSANLDAITVPQFLSLRFHDQRNLLNALGAVIIIVFFVPYTASGFAACGKLFHSLFGVDYMAAMLVSALVIVGYTILGGFRAVTTTDLIQSMVMSLALIAVLGYGIVVAGGWGAVVENAQSLSGYLTMTASHDAVTGGAASYSLLDIVSTMAWGLGYFGMPHILLRFMAIEDEKKLVLSRRIATVWVVIAMAASIVIGMVGLGMTRVGALEFLSGSSSETHRQPHQPARCAGGSPRRTHPCRHPGGYHVHGGQPDAGRCVQCVPEHFAGVRPPQAEREAEPLRRPPDHHLRQRGGRGAGPRPGFQRLRHRQLCVGRFRRLLRRCRPLRPVLEALQLAGCAGRYALRRPDGLRLEVHRQPAGRRLRHL